MKPNERRKRANHHRVREFVAVIERDEEGWYIGSVPGLEGCHTQARSLDELARRLKEAILLCLEAKGEGETEPVLEFIGLQKVTV